MGKLENKFQAQLINDIEKRFDGSIVTKLDSGHIQGIPDLLILYKSKWAALECKKDEKSKHQPNQDYYVGKMNTMAFSRFIYPQNKEETLNELEIYFHES